MKICIVLSTRPEIIKFANLIKIFKQNKIDFFLINTNQHYINIMSDVFFKYFKIPKPKYNIKGKSKTYGGFFSKTIKSIENILHNEKPNYLIVQGDTNTAFAGCFAASIFNRKYFNDEKKIKIIHIEAGLRSFDERMPEEINRKLIDQLSNILFAPTKFDFENLKKERLTLNKKIFTVGNTISDIIKENIPLIKENNILKSFNIKKKDFYLITLHRPETVDDPKKFYKLIIDFEKIGKKFKTKFLFPLHPRTKNILKKLNLKKLNYIKFTRPLEFLDFLTVMSNCKIIFTDSGGIQEESSLLGVPCITIRTTTERQLSIINKSNILTGYNYKRILKAVVYFNKKMVKPSNIFGDGKVSRRIFNILKKINTR
ncbi:non-hydrolyzing UDP-N-acetylglucosamine 2-epimerase [Candidatus Pelagibacter sp.]|uniref:non-hydrolyzing UDP-N-acetylglucosamine 2-epimerase n=1 Tax=Candidatus Pelagibacter sp. TaxID=2024849 RepID=UPI003F83C0FD